MTELEILKEWFRYNAETRPGYLSAIARLPLEEAIADRGASFPLLDIFLHVLDAHRVWLEWAANDRLREWVARRDELRLRTRIRTFPEAEAAMRNVAGMVNGYLASLTESDLPRTIDYDDVDEKGSWFRAHVVVRDMLWHLVEEERQHRGEMNALLWQRDQDPPIVDWIDWKSGRRRP